MKKLFGSVAFRVAVLALSVALQVFSLVAMYAAFRRFFAWFYAFCLLLAAVAVGVIVRKDDVPEYKIAWLIPIMLFPLAGGLVYLMLGRYHLSRREKERVHDIAVHYEKAMSAMPETGAEEALRQQDPSAAQQARYLKHHANAPLFQNTQTRYFPLGEDLLAAMLPELEAAQRFIFMEYFIIRPGKMWDAVLDVLTRKAAEGVDVRLMYDDMGCLFSLPVDFPAQMQARGIQCSAFNRFSTIFNSRFNNRDHRKICVVDGNVGFTGGINLADEYINENRRLGHWKDTAVELRGEGVYSLTVMFLALWDFIRPAREDFSAFAPTLSLTAPGFAQPFTDVPGDEEDVGETMYRNILCKAKQYVYITTPYLIIDSAMSAALTTAAKCGVDVRVITPGIPDKKMVFLLTRSYYKRLLKAGVRVFEYTPGFVHAKEFVSDDTTAVVGTINLDYRSLYLHYECAVWMYGTPAVAAVRDDFLATQRLSCEITLDTLRRLPVYQRALLSFLRVFAPLM